MGKYTHSNQDPWSWVRPTHQDVPAIVELSDRTDSQDIVGILTKNPTRLHYHLHQSILETAYGFNKQLVSIARQDDQIIAWSWLTRDKFSPYADEEMAIAEICTVAPELPVKSKIKLIAQTLDIWSAWCLLNGIPVLTSNTIRAEQSAFMRLHEQAGFTIRGSFAYRRIGE